MNTIQNYFKFNFIVLLIGININAYSCPLDKKDKDEFEIMDPKTNQIIEDLQLTLQSLNYKNKEINTILPIIIGEVDLFAKKENNLSFENLLKLAMNYLDNDSSNLAR